MEKRGVVEEGVTTCDCCCSTATKVKEKTKEACCRMHDADNEELKKSSEASTKRLISFTEPIE